MCIKKILLIKIVCRHCKKLFLMCRRCYRGHVYCGDACRKEAQKTAHRESQRNYRQTDKGKLTHRENEKKRRMGRVQKTMADDSAMPFVIRVLKFPYRSNQEPRCSFCGALGKIINAFPRRRP